jgi:hypothetical protein
MTYDYLSGDKFTSRLKHITRSRTFSDLAELLNIPKSTFSTWNKHNRTSHELMVRLHLRLGIPMDELALDSEGKIHATAIAPHVIEKEQSIDDEYQIKTTSLKSNKLVNGKLIDLGFIPYPLRMLDHFGLNTYNIMELETVEGVYLLDESDTDAVSGNYLIDIDGFLMVRMVQRIPGEILRITLSDSSIDVQDNSVGILGRIAVSLK